MPMTNSRRIWAGAAVLAAGGLIAACGGPSVPIPGESPPLPSATPAATSLVGAGPPLASPAEPATPSATPTPTPSAPLISSIPGFQAGSVTFVSTQDGWVLGTVPCASGGSCLALARTQDGGTTWTPAVAPPAGFLLSSGGTGVSGIRFADQKDGWAFGTQLWATHDGGTTWTQVSLPGLSTEVSPPIQDLEASAGLVHAVYSTSGGFAIATSPVASNSWTASPATIPFGAGPVPIAQLVLQGSAGWALENDRTVAGGARLQGGSWSSWTPPCGAVGGPAALAGSSAQDVVAVCVQGVWAGGAISVQSYVSTDGGSSFTAMATPLPFSAAAVAADGDAPPPAASPSTSVVVAGVEGELLATFDGGTTWSTVYPGAATAMIDYVGFTTSSQGVAIEGTIVGPLGTLLMTMDGGHTWTPVNI